MDDDSLVDFRVCLYASTVECVAKGIWMERRMLEAYATLGDVHDASEHLEEIREQVRGYAERPDVESDDYMQMLIGYAKAIATMSLPVLLE
jgi:hypothetical protein